MALQSVTNGHVRMIAGLQRAGVRPDQIDMLVVSHPHSDHYGHLNLFTRATQYIEPELLLKDRGLYTFTDALVSWVTDVRAKILIAIIYRLKQHLCD